MGKKVVKLEQNEEYITLQSLLKMTDTIQTGGMVKMFLAEEVVLVNGEQETRRGRKLYPGDIVEVLGNTFEVKGLK